ncbi:MAG TPA: CoA transferase [Dehalococcoidia bacterium]|nr:CoA transferase [Dehalococcoidia bacterium]
MQRPLTSVRVLACEQFMMGPFGTMLLGDLGAQVIKIEPIDGGDPSRSIPPFFQGPAGQESTGTFVRLNRNKQSLALNLKSEAGKDVFRALVKVSDAVWENYRPGVMDRLGIGWEALRALNPALIYVSLTGYGHLDIYPSPDSARPAFDLIGQAMSGVMYRAGRPGDPPAYCGYPLADNYPSLMGAFGLVSALFGRTVTGQGQHVDISMVDAMLAANEQVIGHYVQTGEIQPRGGAGFSSPYHSFKAQDGYLVIAAAHTPIWHRLCRVMGRDDLIAETRLDAAIFRMDHTEDIIRPAIEGWAADKPVDRVVGLLSDAGVPASPVYEVDQVAAWPHVTARHMLWEVDHPAAGPVKVVGNPVKLSGAPEEVAAPPPALGEQTDRILTDLLGLSEKEVFRLREGGVVA